MARKRHETTHATGSAFLGLVLALPAFAQDAGAPERYRIPCTERDQGGFRMMRGVRGLVLGVACRDPGKKIG